MTSVQPATHGRSEPVTVPHTGGAQGFARFAPVAGVAHGGHPRVSVPSIPAARWPEMSQ